MTKPKQIDGEKLIGYKVLRSKITYSQKDCILYSLGIGFNQNPLRQQDFKYTNQFHSDFGAFPTLGVTVLDRDELVRYLVEHPHMPYFDPNRILHMGHKLSMIHDQLQIGVQYQNQIELIDCAERGKNALILFRCNSYLRNEKNQRSLAFVNHMLLFFFGLGGFGYKGKGYIQSLAPLPAKKPDFSLLGHTYPNQAFVYRLCADSNPLHIDLEISSALQFERPIIHGLATYGTIARVVVQEIFKNDPTKLKLIQNRFIGHVYPGETLSILVWRQQNRLYYEATVQKRNTKAMVGYIDVKADAKL